MDGYSTAGGGLTSGTEALASDMEGATGTTAPTKKEKDAKKTKKKTTKTKELLTHREKAQPEKIKSE